MVESQGDSGREGSKRDRGRNQALDESNQETESGPEWGRVCALINGQVEVYLIGGSRVKQHQSRVYKGGL